MLDPKAFDSRTCSGVASQLEGDPQVATWLGLHGRLVGLKRVGGIRSRPRQLATGLAMVERKPDLLICRSERLRWHRGRQIGPAQRDVDVEGWGTCDRRVVRRLVGGKPVRPDIGAVGYACVQEHASP